MDLMFALAMYRWIIGIYSNGQNVGEKKKKKKCNWWNALSLIFQKDYSVLPIKD